MRRVRGYSILPLEYLDQDNAGDESADVRPERYAA